MSTRRSVNRLTVASEEERSAASHAKDPACPDSVGGPVGVAPKESPSTATRKKDRSGLCSFTFADGRRCSTPRSSAHPHLCFFHARKEAQAKAAEEIGRDISYFFSGDYLSANDLNAALGRLFAAVAQGQVKPRTASTLAYLGQTLLQSIQIAQDEYINAFGTDSWRATIHSSISDNSSYTAESLDEDPEENAGQALDPALDEDPQPHTAATSE